MTTFFCPACRADFPEDLATCPRCGLAIHEAWRRLDRVGKLLVALGHREAGTRLRAAWLLGETGDPRAVPALAEAARSERDPYLGREAVRALAAIGGAEAETPLRELRRHPSRIVRLAVEAARRKLATGDRLPEVLARPHPGAGE
jgi:HEAT repeat protein